MAHNYKFKLLHQYFFAHGMWLKQCLLLGFCQASTATPYLLSNQLSKNRESCTQHGLIRWNFLKRLFFN